MLRATPTISVMLAAALGGCGGASAFACQDDAACSGAGPGARCEANGYCSFEDEACPNGRRYGDFAGDALGGECVSPTQSTGSTSSGSSSTHDPSLDDSGDPVTGMTEDTGPTPQEPWWDCDWAERRELTIDVPDTGEVLTDVPVLMVLDASRIDASIMALLGRDLRFVGEDGTTELSFEIEQWSPEGLSWVWVRIPELSAGSTRVDMYYGNPGASAMDGSKVWSDYTGVWHMGFELADATGFNTPGEDRATTVAGQAGPGQRFDPPDDGVAVLPSPPLDGLFAAGGTITAMIRPSGWGTSEEGLVVRRADEANGSGGWVLALEGSREALRFSRGFTVNRGIWYTPNQSLTLDAWHHVAVVYQDDPVAPPSLFIDGAPQRLTSQGNPSGRPAPDDADTLYIGGLPNSPSQTFDGIVDEVRVAPVLRSNAWITVQVAALRDELVHYGPPRSSPCPPP